MRTIVVGDVHGCLDELLALVRLVGFQAGKDRLVLMGDLPDRGPYPRECVVWAMQNGVETVRGNHEQKVVEFRQKEDRALAGGPANGMERPFPKRYSEWMSFTDAELAWMDSNPLWIDLGNNFIAVHAGFEPKPLDEQQADRVTRVRWVNEKTGDFVGMKKVPVLGSERPAKTHVSGNRPMTPEALALREQRQQARLAKGLPAVAEQKRRPTKFTTSFDQPEGSVAWQWVWPGPQNVIYGHDAQRSGQVRVDDRGSYVCFGIDTGCCFGENLSAFVLYDDGKFETFHVKAAKKYYEWPKADE
jgi:bis(5'-nucleosyl)-tetraphosphatase (symmetrical)